MDNKKYYWLKLKSDFFDTEDLILLEAMPDGVIYSNILLKLYLKSIQNEILYKSKLNEFIKQPNYIIEKALQLFEDFEFIKIENNIIEILNQDFIKKR